MNKCFNWLANLLWHPKITSITGLLFVIQRTNATKEMWDETKESAIEYIQNHGGFPSIFGLPCGRKLEFQTPEEIMDLPIKDIPCSCGDKKHWFVRFVSYA